MDPKQSANGSDSLPGENVEQSPSGEGKIPQKKSTEQLLGEYKIENERKQTEIRELREFRERAESRLEELENLSRLSASQQAEKARLEQGTTDMEAQIAELERRPDAQAWLKAADLRAQKAASEAVWQRELKAQEKFLKAKASENGVDYAKFVKELAVFQGKYAGEYPSDRAESCYADWQKTRDLEKRETRLKELEEKESQFREDGTRARREGAKAKTIHEVQSESDLIDVTNSIFDRMGKK